MFLSQHPPTSKSPNAWSTTDRDLFTPTDTPGSGESVLKSLRLMQDELAASRAELAAQKAHFQRQLNSQSKQIRMLQETVKELASKLSLNAAENDAYA